MPASFRMPEVCVYCRFSGVAAAILAAEEYGILPPGMATLNAELTAKHTRESAGQDARLYGRRDARRYAKPILRLCGRSLTLNKG